MSEVLSYHSFEPKQSHEFLIDNSVLLYPFAPIGNYNSKLQQAITSFLSTSRTVKAGIHTTSLVISEFYNKVIQDFFRDYQMIPENAGKTSLKKDYRKDIKFKDDIDAINSAVRNILKICTRFPDDFHQIDIERILNGTKLSDFNDSYFIELANRKNWIIVTRDRDIIDNESRQHPVLSFLD